VRACGAAKLFAFETAPERRELAKDMGADNAYDPTALAEDGVDAADLLMHETSGRGISLFAECAGATQTTYPVMERCLAINGKTVQIGHTIGRTPIDLYPYQFNAASITGLTASLASASTLT